MAETNVERRPRGGQGSQLVDRYDPLSHRRFLSPWRSAFSPFDMMRRFAEDMDQFFASPWPSAQNRESGAWWPPIEIAEHEGKMVVRADLPGIDQNDLKLELVDSHLTIEGERKREHEEESGGLRRSERSYGSFYRSIPLPEGANPDEVRAQFKDGVLEVTIPIPESQRRRTIPIARESGERKQISSDTAGAQRQ